MHRRLLALLVLAVPLSLAPQQSDPKPAGAPAADPQRELLEKLTGRWVLRGTIANQITTHDIDAQWVLDKEYVQIHEISREKDAKGKALYEAIVYVVWDPKVGEYACLWLDTTGVSVFPPEGVGHAKPAPDKMPFIFKDAAGGIHTTFAYDRTTDAWTWTIDNEAKGVLTPFARTRLTRP